MNLNAKDTTTYAPNSGVEHLSEKSAKGIMWVALAAVLAIVALLYILARIFSPSVTGDNSQAEQQIVERLRPVAGFSMGAASTGPKTGEEVYNGLCTACHAAGTAGAPKLGDAGAWGPRIGQGFPLLLKHAMEGYTGKTGVMPAKGGGTNSDLEVARAVVFMANKGGASFPEPKDTAADPAAAAAAPAAEAKKP